MLKLSLPQGSMSIEYADDTLIVAEGSTVNEMQERVNAAFDIVSEHIHGLGFCLAIDKAQTVVFTRRHG